MIEPSDAFFGFVVLCHIGAMVLLGHLVCDTWEYLNRPR